MRKLLFTLMLLTITLVARSVTATIYVKADVAPYLYSWCSQDGKTVELLNSWPGTLMTETEAVKGESFWKIFITTPENVTSFNIIFNDGSYYQTEDIIGLSSDRYYTYDGIRGYSDVSEDYETVPNAEISQVELSGFSYSGYSSLMTKEEDYIYTMSVDLSTINNDCSFKLLVNGSIYGDLMSNLVIDAPEGWVEKQGDNCLLHHSMTDYKSYLFTATWEPNVNALEGWTLKVEGVDYRYDNINPTEWQMLAAFYKSAGQGDGWTNKWDFNTAIPSVKTLPGVTAADGHVVGINLSENGLIGTFPFALLALPNLESLNLSHNQLTGDLGVEMDAYIKSNPTAKISLKEINVSNNQFSGNIGLFANCFAGLTSLDASDNCLEDVYPAIPSTVTTLDISKQTISRVVPLHLANLSVDSIATKVPSILLYDHANQTFTPNINLLCTTPDNSWGMTMAYQNGVLSIPYVSEQNTYYGESGDTLNVAVLYNNGSREGSTFRIKLSFDEGDGNFDGHVNVLDLQTILNYMFEEYENKPYNFTATNLWKDEVINVQDAVSLVNILLESNSASAPARAYNHLQRATFSPSDENATAFVADGKLIINSAEPVSSFDIVVATGSEYNMNEALASAGFTCSVKRTENEVHLIGYSLNGATLPMGENVLGTLNEGIVTYSMLADTEAKEITTPFGNNPTGIHSATSVTLKLNEVYRIPLGTKHSIVIDANGKKYMVTEK